MATDTRAEARSLVRSYSFEVEPRFVKGTHAHTLGQALVEEMENGSLDDVTTPWRAFFEPKATGDVSRSVKPSSMASTPLCLLFMLDVISVTQSPTSFEMKRQSYERNVSHSIRGVPKKSG